MRDCRLPSGVCDYRPRYGETTSPASSTALAVLGRKSATRKEKINALENLVVIYARAFLKNPLEWGQLIVREQLHPTTALGTVNQVLERLLIEPLLGLIASLARTSWKIVKLNSWSMTTGELAESSFPIHCIKHPKVNAKAWLFRAAGDALPHRIS
jgi:hypothetical protein